ncbi:hypothetical protein QTH89_14470 [Variovorax sp. J22G21]|uniref:hypothetical protein n=1 Tax=Variovorax TaxID=34072 RepID=UPI002578FBF8|nr:MULTISPECIES: hypothetical protein [unclassified Variovorax]MDM0037627.1 hypothetical protein [Variovorax sp. J22R193]MDM0062403.1 hypothetical protein [Variovorax sp. J22G21]
MYKRLALLLSPLITVGLVYVFGIAAVMVCFALALGTLIFSTGESNDPMAREREQDSSFAGTTLAGSL